MQGSQKWLIHHIADVQQSNYLCLQLFSFFNVPPILKFL